MNMRKSSTRIYVGNIPENKNKTELEDMFSELGQLVNSAIYEDEGYLEYNSE